MQYASDLQHWWHNDVLTLWQSGDILARHAQARKDGGFHSVARPLVGAHPVRLAKANACCFKQDMTQPTVDTLARNPAVLPSVDLDWRTHTQAGTCDHGES